MCIRDRDLPHPLQHQSRRDRPRAARGLRCRPAQRRLPGPCLLYTSDAADERSSVDLGGRRIIKKKTHKRDTQYAYQL